MGFSESRSLESILRHIQALGVEVEIYFGGGTDIVGKISGTKMTGKLSKTVSLTGKITYVGRDFVEIQLPIPGSDRKAICPYYSIMYVAASYETPR